MHMRGFESKRYKPWWLHVLAIAVGGFACLCGERFGYGWEGPLLLRQELWFFQLLFTIARMGVGSASGRL